MLSVKYIGLTSKTEVNITSVNGPLKILVKSGQFREVFVLYSGYTVKQEIAYKIWYLTLILHRI